MSQEDIKQKIIEILQSVNREGMDRLIDFLENSDFFTCPASTKYHGNFAGGLAEHSLAVYNLLSLKNEQFKLGVSDQSVKICGLLHDICKIGTYKIGFKWSKPDEKKWVKEETWKVEDDFPVGHGEKSVTMIQRYIQLTDEEILAIRWHMGFSMPGAHFSPESYAIKAAFNTHKIVAAIFTADMEAAYLVEETREPLSTPAT